MFVAGIIMIALFWGLNEWIRSAVTDGSQEEIVRAEERRKNLAALEEANARELLEYSWVDRGAGTVRIPIQRAMELELASLNSGEPTAAYPIDTLAAQAGADAAAEAAAAEDEAAVEAAAAEESAGEALLEEGESQAADATEAEAQVEEAAP